jgi:predicted secreted Zn-dependent protease
MVSLRRLWLIVIGVASLGCTLVSHLPDPTPDSFVPSPVLAVALSPTATEATAAPSPTASPSPTFTFAPPTPTDVLTSRTTRETRGAVTLIRIANLRRYHISGESVDELDAEMRSVGPVDPLGGFHWFALTEPLFDWRYPCECGDQGCVTGPVTLILTIQYTLPSWIAPEEASEELRAQWAAFELALYSHEWGHGDLAAECAWSLGEAFVALPPAETCADVDQAVSAASQLVFAACREAQRRYEDETNHGQSQGVIWPP